MDKVLMADDIGKELVAMRSCKETLDSLSPEEKQRVIMWLISYHRPKRNPTPMHIPGEVYGDPL